MSQSDEDKLYIDLVKQMKSKDKLEKKDNLEKIKKAKKLIHKCILGRLLLAPQSTDMETIIKKDLHIGKALNTTSGDGHKNGINYEIKVSIHSRDSRINIVQIRPNHNIDFYIIVTYNMYENNTIGKAYILKIPSSIIRNLIIKFGTYAHGTIKELGEIKDNIKKKDSNCEYALRCDPNAKKGKNIELWNELKKYEVKYHPDNF